MKRVLILILIGVIVSMIASFDTEPVLAGSDHSQVQYGDIGRLRRVTGAFFDILSKDPNGKRRNIPLKITYAHRSNYRMDWMQPTWSSIQFVYIWNSPTGPRLRAVTYTPAVLVGCRLGLDSGEFNRDETIPTTDECYWHWHPFWVSRPELDLVDLLEEPELQALWVRLLEKDEHTAVSKKFSRELEFLGLDPTTGLPYSKAEYVPNFPGYAVEGVAAPSGYKGDVQVPTPLLEDMAEDEIFWVYEEDNSLVEDIAENIDVIFIIIAVSVSVLVVIASRVRVPVAA